MKSASLRLLTVREAAEQLSLSIASVYEMVRTCRLPAVRIGGRGGAIRIRPEDLEDFLQASSQQTRKPSAPRVSRRVKLKHIRL